MAAAEPGGASQRARLHRRRPFTPVLVVSPLVSLAFELRWIDGSLGRITVLLNKISISETFLLVLTCRSCLKRVLGLAEGV